MEQFLFAILIIIYSALSFDKISKVEDKFFVFCFSIVNSAFIFTCSTKIFQLLVAQ